MVIAAEETTPHRNVQTEQDSSAAGRQRWVKISTQTGGANRGTLPKMTRKKSTCRGRAPDTATKVRRKKLGVLFTRASYFVRQTMFTQN
jgi:hypothetical protein